MIKIKEYLQIENRLKNEKKHSQDLPINPKRKDKNNKNINTDSDKATNVNVNYNNNLITISKGIPTGLPSSNLVFMLALEEIINKWFDKTNYKNKVDFITNTNEIRKIRYVCSKYNQLILRVDENDSCQPITQKVLDKII